jgi:predicted AlkP superfamily phosphohydrolase/phosphomutase
MAAERALLIIGIDGGTWAVLRPAVEAGAMPHLARLLEEGIAGIAESTVPAITPAAWSSFQTGANPGRTGIVDFSGYDRRRHRFRPADTRRLPRTVWEMAGETGARVGVMNVPMSWPPRSLNGYLVSGLMTPSLEAGFTWPPQLAVDLLAAHPDYHLFHLESAVEEANRDSLEAFLDWIGGVVEGRGRAARWLLAREPLDLFMVHFQAVDVLQHVLWAYLDSGHPRFDAGICRLIHDRFFRLLDREIEHTRSAFDAIATKPWLTFIISDHGFQAHTGRFNLREWLLEEGYLQTVRTGTAADPSRDGGGDTFANDGPPLDPDRSRVVPGGRSNEAFLWLLEEGEARRRTGTALQERLERVRDPATGDQVVARVTWREEIWEGDRMEQLPDLVVIPAGGWSITGRWEADSRLFRPILPGEDFHIGRHHPEGIVVAAGTGVRPDREIHIHLIDIAPTALALLGIEPPDTMDGVVLHELFEAGLPVDGTILPPDRPDQSAAGDDSDDRDGPVYTPEEEALIEQRLRDLGYI